GRISIASTAQVCRFPAAQPWRPAANRAGEAPARDPASTSAAAISTPTGAKTSSASFATSKANRARDSRRHRLVEVDGRTRPDTTHSRPVRDANGGDRTLGSRALGAPARRLLHRLVHRPVLRVRNWVAGVWAPRAVCRRWSQRRPSFAVQKTG